MCRRLRDHHALLARHESAYNKAQEDGRMAEGRLPQLKEQAAQAETERLLTLPSRPSTTLTVSMFPYHTSSYTYSSDHGFSTIQAAFQTHDY